MRSSRVRRASKPPLFRQRGFVRVGAADTLQVGPAFLWEDDGFPVRSGKTIDFSGITLYNHDTKRQTGAQADEQQRGKRLITEYRRKASGGHPLRFAAPFLSNFRIVGTAGCSHRRELLRCGFFAPVSADAAAQEDFMPNQTTKEKNNA